MMISNQSLGEISGFLDAQSYDSLLIGGDFNTNLKSGTLRNSLLRDFMLEFNLACVDYPSTSVTHTYERDDGLDTSWPDHFLCSQQSVQHFSDVRTLQVGQTIFRCVSI